MLEEHPDLPVRVGPEWKANRQAGPSRAFGEQPLISLLKNSPNTKSDPQRRRRDMSLVPAKEARKLRRSGMDP